MGHERDGGLFQDPHAPKRFFKPIACLEPDLVEPGQLGIETRGPQSLRGFITAIHDKLFISSQYFDIISRMNGAPLGLVLQLLWFLVQHKEDDKGHRQRWRQLRPRERQYLASVLSVRRLRAGKTGDDALDVPRRFRGCIERTAREEFWGGSVRAS
mmetsp:Transcript_5735/g.11380  ORF Transcript_5735/g.11380 Transcript_5735/m.11380 type:complete len:156 (-) Transcript_5735:420-887(-)